MTPQEKLDRILRDATSRGGLPGVAAAAATADRVLCQGAAGLRGLGSPAAMTVDTVFSIASMTKAITGAAAMQLVEQGLLSLDQPAGDLVPGLDKPLVLEGFDADGEPRLRLAARPITLRHLLTHTSGLVYDMWNETNRRYQRETGLSPLPGRVFVPENAPLAFDPGERWEYGVGINWAGRMVEEASGEKLDAYLRRHIFAPLGMEDTGFQPRPDQLARCAIPHRRQPDGSLRPQPFLPPTALDHYPGGTRLYSTAPDYLRFLRMLLGGGALDGARVLRPETVALMARTHIGDLPVLKLASTTPELTRDLEFFPGMPKAWGLTFLINTEATATGRAAGSLAWAGLMNTYYWADPARGVAGVLLTQILPFLDPAVLRAFEAFETEVYRSIS